MEEKITDANANPIIKQKTIIAIKGRHDDGKTTTIKNIISLIQKRIPIDSIKLDDRGYEQGAIIISNTIKIGMESQGDPGTQGFLNIKELVNIKCDIIICAARTKNTSYNYVANFANSDGYRIIWATNYRTDDKQNKLFIDSLNNLSSIQIIDLIIEILKGNI